MRAYWLVSVCVCALNAWRKKRLVILTPLVKEEGEGGEGMWRLDKL